MDESLLYIPDTDQDPRGLSLKLMAYRAPCRYENEVYDGQEVVGHVLSVPGFFSLPPSARRERQFKRLVRDFSSLRGRFLCTRRRGMKFLPEERNHLIMRGFVFTTGEVTRQASLLPAFDTLVQKRRLDLFAGPGLVLGADTPCGAEWAGILAQNSKEVVLVGGDQRRLNRLRDRIMYDTGIASQISHEPSARVPDGAVIVAAGGGYGESLNGASKGAIAVLAYSGYNPTAIGKATTVSGGRMTWPDGFDVRGVQSGSHRLLLDAWVLRKTNSPISRTGAWKLMSGSGCKLTHVDFGNVMYEVDAL